MSQEAAYSLYLFGLEFLPLFLWIAVPTIIAMRLIIWAKNKWRYRRH
jgi:hypothetical protein